MHKKVLCIGKMPSSIHLCFHKWDGEVVHLQTTESSITYLEEEERLPQVIVFELYNEKVEEFMQLRHFMFKSPVLRQLPFIVITEYPSERLKHLSQKFKVYAHLHSYGVYSPALCNRILNIMEQKTLPPPPPVSGAGALSIPTWKRAIDIIGALAMIIILSPLILLTAMIIMLESRGPVIYTSKRAGQGYRVFDFYKFRSMRTNADSLLKKVREQNEYGKDVEPPVPEPAGVSKELLFRDNGFIAEEEFQQEKLSEKAGTFVKIKNDPRVTRFGHIIRKTSIDELPQLFNVLKGDMSLVGNRPIPLYEAEQLTSDDFVARFFAPAGITGLWQITKREKNNISERDRKLLDVQYAMNYNLRMDLNILWKTLPAALQRENS